MAPHPTGSAPRADRRCPTCCARKNVAALDGLAAFRSAARKAGFLVTFAWFMLAIVCGFLLGSLLEEAPLEAQQPKRNVVLIVVDDGTLEILNFLPNVRALIADRGVSFAGYYVSTSLCGPSRCSMFTGQYGHTTGVVANGSAEARCRVKVARGLPVWLHDVGYRTGLFGKWLNSYFGAEGSAPQVPPGWDEFWGYDGGYTGFLMSVNGHTQTFDGPNYSTYVIRDAALDFIGSVPSGTPYFVVFTPYAPHDPSTAAAEDEHAFDGLPWGDKPNYNEADVSDKPLFVRSLGLANDQLMRSNHEKVAESLQAVDRAVADIVAAVAARGDLANTYFVFTSDNGFLLGEHRLEGKWVTYEEASHEPLLVRGPGIPKGVTVRPRKLASNVDLAATIADLAGVTPELPQEGVSLRPLLEDPSAPWSRDLLLENRGSGGAKMRYWSVRSSDGWEYSEYDNGERELYDLNADPFQLESRHGQAATAAKQAELAAKLAALRGGAS